MRRLISRCAKPKPKHGLCFGQEINSGDKLHVMKLFFFFFCIFVSLDNNHFVCLQECINARSAQNLYTEKARKSSILMCMMN